MTDALVPAQSMTQLFHELGVTDPALIENTERTVVRIGRLAEQIQDKATRMLEAVAMCTGDDPNMGLFHLRSVAGHAGYSNTMPANVADLMMELGQLTAQVESAVLSGRIK